MSEFILPSVQLCGVLAIQAIGGLRIVHGSTGASRVRPQASTAKLFRSTAPPLGMGVRGAQDCYHTSSKVHHVYD
jgi:hypothetical protein